MGINLLREGLDIPEVALVAIWMRIKKDSSEMKPPLIQTIGRAACNAEGRVILYADVMTRPSRVRSAKLPGGGRYRRNITGNTALPHIHLQRGGRQPGNGQPGGRRSWGNRPGHRIRPGKAHRPLRSRCARPPKNWNSRLPPSCG